MTLTRRGPLRAALGAAAVVLERKVDAPISLAAVMPPSTQAQPGTEDTTRAKGIRVREVVLVVLLLAGLAFAGASPAPADAGADGLSVVGVQKLSPRMSELTVRSNVLLGDVPMRVILPSDYDADQSRRFPVLYMLPGTSQTPAMVTDSVDLETFTANTPVIIVIPSGGNGSYYTNWFNGGLFGPPEWETFHLSQVIPYIDAHYRTVADRSGRAISGISMGGFGSMSYAARHPDLFAAAVSFSGAVNTNYPPQMAVTTESAENDNGAPDSEFGPRATEEVRWRGHNPVDLAENLRGVDVQILAHNGLPGGSYEITGDPLEYGVHQESSDLHDRLAALGVPHAWYDLGPGGHVPGDIQTEIHIALPHVMSVFEHPAPAPDEFTYESIEPEFSVWDWSFRADPARAMEFLRVQDASASGLTLVGSGETMVTTAPLFAKARAVDVVQRGQTRSVRPDASGRIRFDVELGSPHHVQQFTAQARISDQPPVSTHVTLVAHKRRPRH